MLRFLAYIPLLLVFTLGCGEASGSRRAVQGSVKLRGVPLDNGTITFFKSKQQAGGALIKDGAYSLPAPQGLDPGKYLVRINSMEPVAFTPEDYAAGKTPPEAKDRIPPAFNTESKQEVEVKETGVNQFDFAVE